MCAVCSLRARCRGSPVAVCVWTVNVVGVEQVKDCRRETVGVKHLHPVQPEARGLRQEPSAQSFDECFPSSWGEERRQERYMCLCCAAVYVYAADTVMSLLCLLWIPASSLLQSPGCGSRSCLRVNKQKENWELTILLCILIKNI